LVSCPGCSSARIVVALREGRPGSGRCLDCGSGWIQDGASQHSLRPGAFERFPRLRRDLDPVPTPGGGGE